MHFSIIVIALMAMAKPALATTCTPSTPGVKGSPAVYIWADQPGYSSLPSPSTAAEASAAMAAFYQNQSPGNYIPGSFRIWDIWGYMGSVKVTTILGYTSPAQAGYMTDYYPGYGGSVGYWGTVVVPEIISVPEVPGTCTLNTNTYTLSLQNPLADVAPSGTTDVYANTSRTAYAQVLNAQTNQPKAGVQVKFSVDVLANTGGHDGNHYQMRPKGKLLDCSSGSEVETTVCTTQQDGRATVTFNAPIVSGAHTITATCVSPACTGPASGNINVKVPGLETMPYSTLYVFVGGETGKAHTDNHYLTPAASGKIQQLAEAYHSLFPFSPVLRVNDASLVWGGVLDFHGSWTEPHIQHRRGMVIDVRANQLPDAIPNINDYIFQRTIRKLGGRWILEDQGTSNEHYHIQLLGIKG